MGEHVHIMIKNISPFTINFPDSGYGLTIRNTGGNFVCCGGTFPDETPLQPNQNYTYDWNQTKAGQYKISTSYYGGNSSAPDELSKVIEIVKLGQ